MLSMTNVGNGKIVAPPSGTISVIHQVKTDNLLFPL